MCEKCESAGLLHAPIDRRRTLDLLAAGGLAAWLAAWLATLPAGGARAQAPADDKVRIGYLPITDATALLVAHAQGYFKDEGLDAEPPTLMRGWSPLVEAFAARKFNLVHLLKPIPLWMRYNNKFPVKIMAWAHTNGSAVVVGKDTGIASFADLGGRQVAVPYWYSMHNVVLQHVLRASGITPVIKDGGQAVAADECNLQVLAPPDMPPALAARKIDAYIVAEPFNALGELKAGAKMLRFTGDIWKNHPCCVVCMHEDDTAHRREWTQRVVNAIVRAEVFASQNKAEVAKILAKDGKGYLPVTSDVVTRAMTHYDEAAYAELGAIKHKQEFRNGRIDFQPWPYPSATKLIVEAMGRTVVAGDKTFLDGLSPDFVAEDLVDYTYVRSALEKFPEWKQDPSVNAGDPYTRTEVLKV
ncbi:ABC transporter substrate-binding protein [Azospirillum sp. ST 5-10]|uniref:ABC transporter substrate-binding protein n=1 Tax=unclassified Azospirillum TaxID=2630922 RepID=UPI003F4A0CB6